MPPLRCSFCRRPREEVRHLIVAHRERLAEPLIAICDVCAFDALREMTGAIPFSANETAQSSAKDSTA